MGGPSQKSDGRPSQKLAGRIRFVVAGAVRMATLNTAAVFEDFADRLNVGIPQIMACRNVMCTVIDEEVCRQFERNHPVETLFAEFEHPTGFQVTAAQCNQLMSIFGNANTTLHALNVAEAARLNASFEHYDPSGVTALAIRGHAAALVAAHLDKKASTGTGISTTVAPECASAVGGSGGASGSGSCAGASGVGGSGSGAGVCGGGAGSGGA